MLAALKYREQVAGKDRHAVPVPLLFTMRDWNPVSQRIGDWLAGQMRQTYPLFAGKTGVARAAELVAAGKIALILDGLDEMAEDLRPIALRALSRQVTFRVVILSRTAEMASAASRRGVLEGAVAVQLRSLDPDDAADYLTSAQFDPPPDGWRDLIDRIRSKENPIARSLNNPLTVTLVRDTYRAPDDVRELLAFCDEAQGRLSGAALAEKITGHLLDRVLPIAYTCQPGEPEPPYDLRTAHRTLTKIAIQMNQDRTRDLQWWRFPEWAPASPRAIVTGLTAGLIFALAVGLVSVVSFGLVAGVVVGAVIGFAIALALTVTFTIGPGRDITSFPPRSMGKLKHGLRRAVATDNLGISIPVGLIAGLVAGLLGFWPGGLLAGLAGGLAFGIWAALLGGLLDASWYPDSASALTPRGSWRNDMKFAVVVGLMCGFSLGLLIGFKAGPAAGLGAFLVVTPLFGLTGSVAFWSSITAIQFARRWHTPVRLTRFLDDAHARGVLRTVGPVYQFRHASLQDRLAAKAGSFPLPQDQLAVPRQAGLLSTWISFAPDPETSAAYLAEHTHDLTNPQAIALLRDECYSEPADGLMWRHLGLLLLADQSPDAYGAAGTGDPSPLQRTAAMLDNDDLDHALGWACLARAADPGPGALLMGQVYARRGEVGQAAEALNTAVEHLGSEQLSEVIAVYDHLLTAQPGQPLLHTLYALALQCAGQLEAALAAYDRALSLAPKDPSWHFNRGNLLFSMSRFEEAQDEFLTVTQLRPGDILGPAVLLAAIAWPTAPDQARQHLQAALSSPGERLSPFTRAYFRAIALAGLGQASKACTELKEAESVRTPQETKLDDGDRIIFARFSDPPLPGLELIKQLFEPGPDGIQAPDEPSNSDHLKAAAPD
jgi:tetratricopeptide (TPR) repeat protein